MHWIKFQFETNVNALDQLLRRVVKVKLTVLPFKRLRLRENVPQFVTTDFQHFETGL